MTDRKRFFISTLIVGIASLLSRVLGLLRSTLLASFYGATESAGLADCYQASFTLPDIIYNLIVLGAISIVLVPYFSASIQKKDNNDLDTKSSALLNFFFLLITLFSIIAWIFAPFFVKELLIRGWTDQTKIDLTIKLTRIMLLQPIFMSLSGILGAYINSKEKYTSYSLAMLSYNAGIIGGIVFLSGPFGIEGVAWGTVIGSFMQFSIQAIGVFMTGFKYKLILPQFNKEFRDLFLIAIPRIIAIGSEQFVRFFFTYLGSFIFTGSIIIFSYAENFSMVPFGMVAVSLSTTAFPIFSKLFAENKFDTMLFSLFDTLRMLLFFIVPITIIMMILRFEIIDILLGYNKFSSNDTMITANALLTYMIGIPFYSITIVLAKYFYAQKKTFEPMLISLISSAITVLVCFILIKNLPAQMGVTGLTIGRSTGYALQAILLFYMLFLEGKYRNLYRTYPYKDFFQIGKIIVINAGLIAVGLTIKFVTPPFFSGKLLSLFAIGIIGIICGIYYIFASFLFKIPELEVFNRMFRKLTKR